MINRKIFCKSGPRSQLTQRVARVRLRWQSWLIECAVVAVRVQAGLLSGDAVSTAAEDARSGRVQRDLQPRLRRRRDEGTVLRGRDFTL